MIHGKVWGETWEIFSRNGVRCMGLRIKAGHYCSKHKHKHQYNHFAVLDGDLKIRVWKNDYDLVDETWMCGQDCTIVVPGEYHQFEALTDVLAVETYWGECVPSDIVRASCGGSTSGNA
jgi:tellurite resistance-related uncharacterized protein